MSAAPSVLLAVALAVSGCDSRARPTAGEAGAAAGQSASASAGAGAASGAASPEVTGGAAAVPAGHLVERAALARVLREGNREQWFGLYFQNKKVGYASTVVRPASPATGGRVLVAVTGVLRSGGLGSSAEAAFAEDRLYAAAAPHRLVEVRSSERSGTGKVERVYRNQPDAMIAAQVNDGVAQPERRLAPSREDLYGALDLQVAEPAGLRRGQRAVIAEWDSSSERDKQTAIEVREVRRERLAGVETEVATLASRAEGEQAVTETRLAAGGVTLRASLGAQIELRWEEKARAQSDVVGFDMVADAVPVDRPLGDPAALRELHLVVGVPDSFRLRDAPNQEIARRPDGKLDVALFSRPGLPVLAGERAAALGSDGRIDAADPQVAARARELVAGVGRREEAVGRLVEWVYRTLDKDLSSNVVTASQVLARRGGDCTEHALLFVALARAAGIPAREVSGLLYMGDDIRRFGWHAWAEVDLDGRWVQVDPSWNEPVASAAHLALGVGDDADWVTAMDSITIEAAPAPP